MDAERSLLGDASMYSSFAILLSPVNLLQFNDHLANILSLEKTDERSYRMVYSFHHSLFVFQLAGLKVATSLFSKLRLSIHPIKNHQAFHRQPFGRYVKEIGRTGNRTFRVIGGDTAAGD